ncbi:MAG: hypothetical protein M1828_002566 [Chrysothrix sp. TS-e1954]|nr:MAG: hypothetical protein M1828_002566 [Chrysothrix sp. TS-e1954]
MEFEPSHYRQYTPPSGTDFLDPSSAGSTRSYNHTNRSFSSSPKSSRTHITTPPRSPRSHNGPLLLPKVRVQDQSLDPVADIAQHARHSSLTSTGFPLEASRHVSPAALSYHRSASPPDMHLMTPISASSPCDDQMWAMPTMDENPTRPPLFHSRTTSTCSRKDVHSRNSSININDAAIRKYICPTYRNSTGYMAASTSMAAPIITPQVSIPTSTTLPTLAPNYQARTEPQPSFLPAELLYDTYSEPPPSTTLVDYLTAPNPSPALVRRTIQPNRIHDTHFWWDIRNLRTWSDFNLATVRNIPHFAQLLTSSVPEPALPMPPRPNLHPDTVPALHDTYRDYYAAKVNNALKVALGSSHPTMRAIKPQGASAAGPRNQHAPDFISTYDTDYAPTGGLNGTTGRARVVGLIRAFDQWNTGMRAEPGAAKIDYLRELACLHRHMRENACRYGFIITEIELVCVRAGAGNVPYFGLLELSPPIKLNHFGPVSMSDSDSLHDSRLDGELTACLALWYLHMLAKNAPLPGQASWKIDVGGPAALTRQHITAERDSWMSHLKPEGREKRDAKRNRGWILPGDALSRKEVGKGRKSWAG